MSEQAVVCSECGETVVVVGYDGDGRPFRREHCPTCGGGAGRARRDRGVLPAEHGGAVMAEQDTAQWLTEAQARMGISYVGIDPEPALRAAFAQMVTGIPGATGEVSGVTYTGYREQKVADGRRERTSLKKLHGSVRLPDGRTYGVTVEGEYQT